MKKVLLATLATLALSACVATHQGVPTGTLTLGGVESNRTANIQIGPKVSGNAKGTVVLGFIKLGDDTKYADGVNFGMGGLVSPLDPTADLKAAAAYKAVNSGNGDVLYAPIYEVEEENYVLWKKYNVNVNAYSGKITGIK